MIDTKQFIAGVRLIDKDFLSYYKGSDFKDNSYNALYVAYKNNWKKPLEKHLQENMPRTKEEITILLGAVKKAFSKFESPLYISLMSSTSFGEPVNELDLARFYVEGWKKEQYEIIIKELKKAKTPQKIENVIASYKTAEMIKDGSYYHFYTRFRPRHPIYYLIKSLEQQFETKERNTFNIDVERLIPRLHDHILMIKNKNTQDYLLALSIISGIKPSILISVNFRNLKPIDDFCISYNTADDTKIRKSLLLCRSSDFIRSMAYAVTREYSDNVINHPSSKSPENLGLKGLSYKYVNNLHAELVKYFFDGTQQYKLYEADKEPTSKSVSVFQITGNKNLTAIIEQEYLRRATALEELRKTRNPKEFEKIEKALELTHSTLEWKPNIATIKKELGGTSETATAVAAAIASLDSGA